MELLIEQVQRISPIDSSNKKFDLSYFNHPVKCLLWGNPGTDPSLSNLQTSDVQLYLNGTEMFNSVMPNIYFTQVNGYYHSEFGTELLKGSNGGDTGSNLKMYSFALKANKHQPCGTCNFSRLDNGALTFGTILNAPSPFYLYAVNFNVLRIKDGVGGLMFSN
jgi:hypothetical protein